jgi:hypothetical protein
MIIVQTPIVMQMGFPEWDSFELLIFTTIVYYKRRLVKVFIQMKKFKRLFDSEARREKEIERIERDERGKKEMERDRETEREDKKMKEGRKRWKEERDRERRR